MRASSSSSISETFLLFSQYSPCDGVSRHPIRFIRVDLPEPDGPVIARYSPRRTSNVTPCSACTFSAPMSYVFQMLRIAISEVLLPTCEGGSGCTAVADDFVSVASAIWIGSCTLSQREKRSTRLNSSHSQISYAVFCLKKKNYRSNSTRTRCTLFSQLVRYW